MSVSQEIRMEAFALDKLFYRIEVSKHGWRIHPRLSNKIHN